MAFILSLFLVALLVAGRSAAAPVKGKKAVDSNLLASFNLIEQYAAAAYCSNNHDSPGDEISCNSGNCPLAQAAKTTSVLEFEFTEATGFVAVDDTNQLIVVSFRGSYSPEDWATNLDLGVVNTNLCSGCTAHRGFWNSWLKSRDRVLAAVKTSLQAHPKYQVVSTGHSLGGALATLAAADLRNNGYSVALYSFGAPRIASLKLSKYISDQPGGNYRITHWNDLVPQLPPVWMNFAHISPEYYIKKLSLQSVDASNIQVYEGNLNWFGNGIFVGNGGWLVTDIGAHLWYFNAITACGSDKSLYSRDPDGDVEVVAKF
ncbi:alpha/beta-hydrolase [Melanomma pulvis-pyrius CBS 109.77]|uniref:Alpha/beta-hydrolase n=1 Tax=Melanomma pulvis-pyrius CBS 109.77 TaxID=1314802 RepID=A0A6A6XIP4_9PLEO|nr:alpha/beta-hydrolase [Melanomma pulvis-pyrius CBS 109.77]